MFWLWRLWCFTDVSCLTCLFALEIKHSTAQKLQAFHGARHVAETPYFRPGAFLLAFFWLPSQPIKYFFCNVVKEPHRLCWLCLTCELLSSGRKQRKSCAEFRADLFFVNHLHSSDGGSAQISIFSSDRKLQYGGRLIYSQSAVRPSVGNTNRLRTKLPLL